MIQHNAAGQFVLVGPLETIADGSPVAVASLTLFGASGAGVAAATAPEHVGGGVFRCTFTQAETNVAGRQIGLLLVGVGARAIGVTVPVTRVPFGVAAGAAGGVALHDQAAAAATDAATLAARLTAARAAKLDDLTSPADAGMIVGASATTATLASTAPAHAIPSGSAILRITAGPGAGQSYALADYDPSTKVATTWEPWRVVPTTASRYRLDLDDAASRALAQGRLTAAGATTATLDADPAGVNLADGQCILYVYHESGPGQARLITGYDPVTRVATVDVAWSLPPLAGDLFLVHSQPRASVALSPAERRALADAYLGRNHEGGSDGGRTVAQCHGAARNKVVFGAEGTFTVYRGDDETEWFGGTYTMDPAAAPVTGVDPT